MFKKKVLDAVEVKSPCGESWDEMRGNDKVRFCSHCSKNVSNVSKMTRKEAYRLIRESNGSLCVQYITAPATNKPLYLNDLYKITRRAPSLAAGVVAASIGFSATAYAQDSTPVPVADAPAAQKVIEPGDVIEFGKIAGTITSQDGKPLISVTVTLTDEESGEINQAITDAEGAYAFEYLTGKSYRITVSAQGFASIDASKKSSAQNNVVLTAAGNEVPPVAVTDTVLTQQIIDSLPIRSENLVVLGGAIGVSVPEYDYALSRAVQNEDIDKVKSLIYRGARINAKEKNHENTTALFVAVESGNKAIVEILLRFGAKVNARSTSRQTPLMVLDDDAEEGLVELLVKHGASVDLTDDEGNTALIYAIHNAELKTVQALIRAGANVNLQNKEGRTALMLAAERDDLEKVRALILAGADANLKDKEGDTAWDLTSDAQVESLLEAYGGASGDPETVDDDGPLPATEPVETDN